jgi:hypothetical protein
MKMKKGDTIRQEEQIPAGTVLMKGFHTLEEARSKVHTIPKYYHLNEDARYEAAPDPNSPESFAIVAINDITSYQDAVINWRVENDIGISYISSGGSNVINLVEDPSWKVIQEAPVSYQSSIAHMSDDDLKASLEALRLSRHAVNTRKSKRAKAKPKTTTKEDKFYAYIKTLPQEEALALMQKLGMV